MKCIDTSKLIIDKLAGELSPRQVNKMTKHLAGCDACRKEAEMLNQAWEDSKKTLKEDVFSKELTPDRRARIFAAAEYEKKHQRSSRIVTRAVEYFVVIAIVFILAGMMLPALNQSREKARRISAASTKKQEAIHAMMDKMDAEEKSEKDSLGEDEGAFGDDSDTFAYAPAAKKSKRRYKTATDSIAAGSVALSPSPWTQNISAPQALKSPVQAPSMRARSAELRWESVIVKREKSKFARTKRISAPMERIEKQVRKSPEVKLSYEVTAKKQNKDHYRKIEKEQKLLEMNYKADINKRPASSYGNVLYLDGKVRKGIKVKNEPRISACVAAPPMPKQTFKLNLKLWNMTTVYNVRKYLKENKYPVPTNIRVYKRQNIIIIRAPKTTLKKIDELFKKLQDEEKELKDLSKGLPFIKCLSRPTSTFSIDTDTASYVQARKSIRRGERPNPLKIRPEEFINYFDYNYRSPQNTTFAVYPEAAPSPFRPNNTLFRIGIQGKRLGPNANTRTHYTILLDTSGSMAVKDRMELAKKALDMLLKKLKSSDYVSLLLCGTKTYSVFSVKALTSYNRQRLLNKLNNVTPLGVADFAKGISKAYAFAGRHFLRNGSNRVIIISDGIFEIDSDGQQAITKQIEGARKRGISNIVIGLGGDGDDNTLEKVASIGDGSYVFLDTEREAKELFSTQFEARFREIARDVKIQVQFNPKTVKSYRQIGYKNRQLSNADFRNDKVDAGEVGSGQSVTALYELKLKDNIPKDTIVATVRIRYKKAGDMSIEEKAFSLYESDIKEKFKASSANFQLASFVSEFAESLRYPETQGIASLRGVADQLNGTWMKYYSKDHKVTELLSLIKRSR